MLRNFDFRVNDVVSFEIDVDKRKETIKRKGKIIFLSKCGRWASVQIFERNNKKWIEGMFLEDILIIRKD